MHHLNSLFVRIAGGDEKAFEEVFYTYCTPLREKINKIIKDREAAHDIVQEVFLQLWISRQQASTIVNPAGWLNRVTLRRAINHLSRRQITHKVAWYIEAVEKVGVEDGFYALELQQMKAFLRKGLDQLPPRRREIIQLRLEEGLNRREIAQRLNISENMVRNQYFLSVDFLREYLKKHTGATVPLVILF